MPNHYEILGLQSNADEGEIKKAYRSLSFKYHPDRATCDPDESNKMMQKLNEAYEILRDPQKRQQYDNELNGVHAHNGFPGFPMHGMPPGMPDIFEMMFNMGGMHGMRGGFGGIEIVHNGQGTFIKRHIGKPQTISKSVSITLEQAFVGGVLPVEIERWVQNGDLQITEMETINVNIPAGINNNDSILLEGIGNRINASHVGDVKLQIVIENHATFTRQGNDLIFKKNLTLKEALCGTQFQFEHLNGKMLTLNVSNTVIFPGGRKAFPNLGMTTSGNLIVEFDVTFPASLTTEQKDQLSIIL
jgi:DnaJ family protein B protein 4